MKFVSMILMGNNGNLCPRINLRDSAFEHYFEATLIISDKSLYTDIYYVFGTGFIFIFYFQGANGMSVCPSGMSVCPSGMSVRHLP